MSNDHIVIGNNCFRCLKCGDENEIEMPITLSELAERGDRFIARHRNCKVQ